MARKFKDFVERDKPRKRPRRHCKSPNKKRNCKIIKNIIDRDVDKNNRRLK